MPLADSAGAQADGGSRRQRLYQTEALVLRQRDYGEADRILTLLTPGGKITALAPGIRRVTSRKAGHLQLFARSRVLLARGRNFEIVTQAENLETFELLGQDVLRFTYACYAAELLDRFAQEEEIDTGLYALGIQAFRWFSYESNLELWARYFELRLLTESGYRPQLFECVACSRPIQPEINFFRAEDGGLLCPHCGTAHPDAKAVSVNAQKVLRYLATHSPTEVRLLRISQGTLSELESLLHHYLQHILERELSSISFLNRLRRELQTLRARGASPT